MTQGIRESISSPITAARRIGWWAVVFQDAPLGNVHFCRALCAKKAYCKALAWPEVTRTLKSSLSLRSPSGKGRYRTPRTAWKHNSGERHPWASFFSFKSASWRTVSMFGNLGTGFVLTLRGPTGWSIVAEKLNYKMSQSTFLRQIKEQLLPSSARKKWDYTLCCWLFIIKSTEYNGFINCNFPPWL